MEQTPRKVLGISLVSNAELEKIITETDAAVNNRPITCDIIINHNHSTRTRVEWKIGKVTELIPGKYEEERVDKVLFNKTKLTRATYKLYPLEINAKIDASDSTIGCKDGSSAEHSEQSDSLTKER